MVLLFRDRCGITFYITDRYACHTLVMPTLIRWAMMAGRNVRMDRFDHNQLLNAVVSLGYAQRRVIADAAELSKRDEAFFITAGKALIREGAVLSNGLDSTQTFTTGDSIYLAAALSKRSRDWQFTIHEPLELIAIDGATIRSAVMKSGFLVAEVIRNSVTRIFDVKQRENAAFENRFLKQYLRIAPISRYSAGDSIYRIGESAEGLYFIAEGTVYLTTARNAKFAELHETDFFGEASLLSSGRRSKNIYAKTDCSVLLLDAATVKQEVARESPLVQLILLNILNVLELMNQLRFSHLNMTNFGSSE